MQQKEKPAAAEELAVPAKANPLETFGSLFGTARPRPPSALWPRPPLCSSWPPQRPHATRLLAKKPAATTTSTPARQPEAAKPTHKVECPGGPRLLFLVAPPSPRPPSRPRPPSPSNPPLKPPVKPAPPTPHSQSPDEQEGVKATNTKELRRKNSAVQEKLQSPAPSKVNTLHGGGEGGDLLLLLLLPHREGDDGLR